MSLQLFKNKHLILAMFIAPVLAIIAYFSVDYMVSEKPHAAAQGKSYKLAAKSNCRYQSGLCTLQNGDIEVELRAQRLAGNQTEVSIHSNLPVEHAVISSVESNTPAPPVVMKAAAENSNSWYAVLPLGNPETSQLRLALSISGSMYYAETTAVFIEYETSFSRENFAR